MIPEVPLPRGSKIRTPIDLKLKSAWRFDSRRGVFVSADQTFKPELPPKSRIVYKVPSLAKADPSKLSKAERDLQRYIQVILPPGRRPAAYLERIRAWPCIAEAHVAPRVSLP
jgi:hypothetical protein